MRWCCLVFGENDKARSVREDLSKTSPTQPYASNKVWLPLCPLIHGDGQGNNLSSYKSEDLPNGAHFNVGIVVSEWNQNTTSVACSTGAKGRAS